MGVMARGYDVFKYALSTFVIASVVAPMGAIREEYLGSSLGTIQSTEG